MVLARIAAKSSAPGFDAIIGSGRFIVTRVDCKQAIAHQQQKHQS